MIVFWPSALLILYSLGTNKINIFSDSRDLFLAITSLSSVLGCLVVLWRFYHTNQKPVSLKMIAILTASDLLSCSAFFIWNRAYGFATTEIPAVVQAVLGALMEFSIIWSCNIAHFVYKSVKGDKNLEADQPLAKRLPIAALLH